MADRSSMTAPDADREFEMVLGNKQLFSVLFIVFVLLGVFFAMGYMMGRNSTPVDLLAAKKTEGASEASEKNLPAGDRPAPSSGVEAHSGSAAAAPPETAPASSANSVSIPAGGNAVPVPQDVRPAAPRAAAEPDLTTASRTVTEPKPGQKFWQVSAVPRAEAEVLVEVLAKKRLPAIVSASPDPRLFRVLVGPARDENDYTRLRTELEKSGFKPYPRRF